MLRFEAADLPLAPMLYPHVPLQVGVMGVDLPALAPTVKHINNLDIKEFDFKFNNLI